jgi:hypothetical protein
VGAIKSAATLRGAGLLRIRPALFAVGIKSIDTVCRYVAAAPVTIDAVAVSLDEAAGNRQEAVADTQVHPEVRSQDGAEANWALPAHLAPAV